MKRTYFIVLGTAACLLALLYFVFDARVYPFPRCPFNLLTGWLCPGCGSQRAFSALLHGDLPAAFRLNALLMALLPLLLYALAVQAFPAWGRRQAAVRLLYSPLFVRGILIAVLAFWIARNLSLYPFNLLAPH